MGPHGAVLLVALCPLAPAQPGEPTDPERLARLSVELLHSGRVVDAHATLVEALRIEKANHRRPVLRSAILSSIGAVSRRLGKGEQVERSFQQAISILERAHGADAPGLPPVLNNLGLLYNEFGQHRRAERVFRRALAILWQDPHPVAEDLPLALNGPALALLPSGDKAASEDLLRQSVAAWDGGPSSPFSLSAAAGCQMNLAILIARKGRPVEALPLARASAERTERLSGRDHPDFAVALLNYFEVLARAEQGSEARAALNEAMDIAGRTLASQPAVMARFSERQADLLRRAGDKEGAKAAARRARQWWDRAASATPGRHTVDFEDLQRERARR